MAENKSEIIDLPDRQYRELIYKVLIEEHLRYRHDDERYTVDEERDYFREWRREDLRGFRQWLEEALKRSSLFPERLTWRDVPFYVNKIKVCANCGQPFYDTSRNGKMTLCRRDPYLRYNYARGRQQRSYHADGREKSNCEMEWKAMRERRRFNIRRWGRDTTDKLWFPAGVPRYKVKRRLGWRNGKPPEDFFDDGEETP